MARYKQVFDDLKGESYTDKTQILAVLLNAFENNRKEIGFEDRDEIAAFAFEEMTLLIDRIHQATSFKDKDLLIDYQDKLMGLYAFLRACKYEFDPLQSEIVKTVCRICDEARVLENALDQAMERTVVEKDDVETWLDMARSTTDEYQKGKVYAGLHYHAKQLDKLTDAAKTAVGAYIASEIERYLQMDALTEDAGNALEYAADVCRYFIDDKMLSLLEELLRLACNNVRYYAMASYIEAGRKPAVETVRAMAEDLVYADLTYSLLKEHGLTELFPKEYRDPAYLAKSDMVHWLTYPTELGKAPDAIELLGLVSVKKQAYYVFKFRSDSDTLADENKNRWLIGWASDDGGTFSHFDPLSQFEQKTVEKTLKVIRKKCLG